MDVIIHLYEKSLAYHVRPVYRTVVHIEDYLLTEYLALLIPQYGIAEQRQT